MSDSDQPVETDVAAPPSPTTGGGEAFELGYVVALDQFSGPMDLLLYLVRRTELDIVEIPIATITDQFVATIHLWKSLDLDVAGDFIVMAATLLELKARQLAPPPESSEGSVPEEPDEVFDPRSDLIQRLLAYRRFKDASQLLDGLQEDAAGRVGRQMREAIPEDPDADDEIRLEDLDVHALFRSYELVMARINGLGPRRVVFDEVPMNVRVQKLLETLRTERTATLQHYLTREPSRLGQAGVLVAALECVRQRFMEVRQLEQYGAVDLRWRDDAERTAVLSPPPEEAEPGGRRRRRLPLVTWTARADAPAESADDSDPEAEEGPQETDEQRFLRELDASCDLSAVLARGTDIEASFAAHWATIHPPPPAAEVVPVAIETAAPEQAPIARARPKPRESVAAKPAPPVAEAVAEIPPPTQASAPLLALVVEPDVTLPTEHLAHPDVDEAPALAADCAIMVEPTSAGPDLSPAAPDTAPESGPPEIASTPASDEVSQPQVHAAAAEAETPADDEPPADDAGADNDPALVTAVAETQPTVPHPDQPLGAETLGRLAALIPDAAADTDDIDDTAEHLAAAPPQVDAPSEAPHAAERLFAAVEAALAHDEDDDADVGDDPAAANAALLGERRRPLPKDETWFASGSDADDDDEPAEDDVAAANAALLDDERREAAAVPDDQAVAPRAVDEAQAATLADVAAGDETPVDDESADSDPGLLTTLAEAEPTPPRQDHHLGSETLARLAALIPDAAADDADDEAEAAAPPDRPSESAATVPEQGETVVRLAAMASHAAELDADDEDSDPPASSDPIREADQSLPAEVAAPADDRALAESAASPLSTPSAPEPTPATALVDLARDQVAAAPVTVPDEHETVVRSASLVGHDHADPGEGGPPADEPPDPPDGPPPAAPPAPLPIALTEIPPTDLAPMPAPPTTPIRPWLPIVLALALVNALGWLGYVWLVRLPRAVLEVSTPAAVLPGDAWTWRFNLDVVADLAVGTTPEQVPTIEPHVPGAWSWRDQRTLDFVPTVDLPPATTFVVRLAERDLRSVSGFRLAQDQICAVRTPPLRAEGVRQVTFNAAGEYTVELAFDRPVNPAALAGRIVVEPAAGGASLPVTTTTTARGTTLRLAVGPSPALDGGDARVRLTPAPAGPPRLDVDAPLRLDPSWSATLGLGHRLALREAVASAPTRGDPSLTLRFADREVPLDLAARLVRVEPAVPFTPRAAGGALVLTGAFIPGDTYRVVLDAAWPEGTAPAHDLAAYPAAGAAQVTVGDRAPGAWFVRDGERLRIGAVNLGSATLAVVAADGGQVGSHLLDLAGARNATTVLDLAPDDLLAGLPAGDYRLVLAAADGEIAAASVAVREVPLSALRLAVVLDRWTSALAAGDATAQPMLRLSIPGP